VPALPSLLLSQGRYDRSIDVMVGHNGDEGFGYPSLQTDIAFDGESILIEPTSRGWTDVRIASIKSLFPNAPSSELEYITQELYPPKARSIGAMPGDYEPNSSTSIIVTSYNDTQGRQALFTSDTVINCNTHFVNEAFKGLTYSYILAVPPALHGQDLYYVFYNGQPTDIFFRPINVTLAHIIQDYWINFAQSGNPNSRGLPFFPRWGSNMSVQGLSHDAVGPTQDTINVDACRWWQLGLYL
jgi:cholinesterase